MTAVRKRFVGSVLLVVGVAGLTAVIFAIAMGSATAIIGVVPRLKIEVPRVAEHSSPLPNSATITNEFVPLDAGRGLRAAVRPVHARQEGHRPGSGDVQRVVARSRRPHHAGLAATAFRGRREVACPHGQQRPVSIRDRCRRHHDCGRCSPWLSPSRSCSRWISRALCQPRKDRRPACLDFPRP